MKLALDRPVKIVIIGAGGTGGNIIPHLYRIAFSSDRHCKIVICDGDIVERKNLIRQNFAACDIGENKAQVKPLFLLVVQPHKGTVVLRGNPGSPEHIVFQLLPGVCGVQHQKGKLEHPFIPALQGL